MFGPFAIYIHDDIISAPYAASLSLNCELYTEILEESRGQKNAEPVSCITKW